MMLYPLVMDAKAPTLAGIKGWFAIRTRRQRQKQLAAE